jgi:RecA-family ATPase
VVNNSDEKGYLGRLLLASEKNERIPIILQSDDFVYPGYGRIFNTILKQWESGIIPSIATLINELPDIPQADIADITSGAFSIANITYYEKNIINKSMKRKFDKALNLALNELHTGTDPSISARNLIPTIERIINANNELDIKSAAELFNTQFDDIRWIVPGLIGEGLTLINGAPKIGKSWFVLALAISASAGGKFLGKLEIPKTDTLYLALEDTKRRIHNRLVQLSSPGLENLKIATQWKDGYRGLSNFLSENRSIRLIIIDTLARFANIEDMNNYATTTVAMVHLKKIAETMGVAIVLIHHAKKIGSNSNSADWMESALGSTGLTGATDSTIFISRQRGKNTATLYATGRDIQDIKYNLEMNFTCGCWIIIDG